MLRYVAVTIQVVVGLGILWYGIRLNRRLEAEALEEPIDLEA
jgi:hypothetical protein